MWQLFEMQSMYASFVMLLFKQHVLIYNNNNSCNKKKIKQIKKN